MFGFLILIPTLNNGNLNCFDVSVSLIRGGGSKMVGWLVGWFMAY